MNINTAELKSILKKATLNYVIDSVQLNFTKDFISSKMISSSSDAISILNVTKTVLPTMAKKDTLTFNFLETNITLISYLGLIDDERETEIKIHDEKITLIQDKQKSNIFFCSPQVVNIFEADAPRTDIEYFTEINVNDIFLESFNKIKKIGSKFNKIYFGVDSGNLYIETSDKQNRFSNGLRIDLAEVEFDDMSICFDFKNIVNTIGILGDDFKINIAYVKDQNLGMLFIGNTDKNEKYYLMSKTDR